MKQNLKIQFQDKMHTEGFIKITETPKTTLSSEEKAILNRKGNMYFNKGDINTARRIFLATGYSDGLTRVGDTYYKLGDELKALKMYWLAHNKKKSDLIIQRAASLISGILKEEASHE